MKLLTACAALLAPLALSACVVVIGTDGSDGFYFGDRQRGSGHRAEETREVPAFSAVKLENSGHAWVHVGQPTSLEVSGDDDLLPHLETTVEHGTLLVRLPRKYKPRATLRITIGTPALEEIEVGGSGNIEILNAKGEELRVALRGSGHLKATGAVDRLHASIGGSGHIRMGELHAQEASVSVGGSGNIDVYASRKLHYDISGSGDVRFLGDPSLSGKISGSGSVRHD